MLLGPSPAGAEERGVGCGNPGSAGRCLAPSTPSQVSPLSQRAPWGEPRAAVPRTGSPLCSDSELSSRPDSKPVSREPAWDPSRPRPASPPQMQLCRWGCAPAPRQTATPPCSALPSPLTPCAGKGAGTGEGRVERPGLLSLPPHGFPWESRGAGGGARGENV